MYSNGPRTTISVSKTTKDKMDKWRATGQCYDGFLLQMVELWEKARNPANTKQLSDIKS